MPRQPTDTKSKILNVTRTLYSTHGCENTTIDDIITAIGITKGAFYHYFRSKEDLCKTVIASVIEDYQNLAQSINPDIEPIEQLRQMIDKLAQLNASGRWVNTLTGIWSNRTGANSNARRSWASEKLEQPMAPILPHCCSSYSASAARPTSLSPSGQ